MNILVDIGKSTLSPIGKTLSPKKENKNIHRNSLSAIDAEKNEKEAKNGVPKREGIRRGSCFPLSVEKIKPEIKIKSEKSAR